MRTFETADPPARRRPLGSTQTGGVVVALLSALCLSCSGDHGGDGGTPPSDGGMVTRSCDGRPPADLGRCELAGGGDCMGAPGEMSSFVSLGSGGTMNMVIGPQGSTMLVFAMRAPGIAPGSGASDWPLVELALLDSSSGRQLALYRSRQEFTGSTPEALQLWVVVDDLAGTLGGRTVIALATVRDNAGLELCGSTTVTVGG